MFEKGIAPGQGTPGNDQKYAAMHSDDEPARATHFYMLLNTKNFRRMNAKYPKIASELLESGCISDIELFDELGRKRALEFERSFVKGVGKDKLRTHVERGVRFYLLPAVLAYG